MLISIFGLLLLAYSLANLPTLYRNKKATGFYFPHNSRFMVTKELHFGNGLNMKNKYAFSVNILLAVLLILLGMIAD